MPTQRPLRELIPDILRHIFKNQEFTQFQQKLYYILQGQIHQEVEDALRREILSPAAFRRIRERIPPINVLRKVSDKLSKVYTEPPNRILNSPRDQDLLDKFVKDSCVDQALHTSQILLNAQHMFSIEPYVSNGMPALRILGGHQFLPYSDNPSNPNEMTVYIKFLGREKELFITSFDREGDLIDEKDVGDREIFALVSDDEQVVIDESGAVRFDLMSKMGMSSDINELGRIPSIYGRINDMELVPFANKEGYDISILIPKLLADLAFAAQFNSHSIIWTKNVKDLEGQEINPDAILDLGDGSREDGEPEIGMLRPEVNMDDQLKFTDYIASKYMEGKGIRLQGNSIMANGRDSSAVGKALDDADTTMERKRQMEYYRKIEVQLWDLLKDMQALWSRQGRVDDRRVFTPTAFDSLSVSYSEIRPVKTRKQLTDELRDLRSLKMITRNQMLKELRPELTEEQRKSWLDEVKKEEEEDFQNLLLGKPTSLSERNSSGQFNEGNQAAANQDEVSKDESKLDERAPGNS